MIIEKVVVGELATNCYLVYEDKKETLIIDPGDDAEVIVNRMRDLELIPKLVLATHGHFDHLLAANELKLSFNIPFLMPKKDKGMLKWYRKSTKYFTGFDPGPAPKPSAYIEDIVAIGKLKFEIINTPGHTPGGVCLYSEKERVLFSGDTLFAEGAVGRTDYPYCSKSDLNMSIKKLMRLPGETGVYPGHGEETRIKDETNHHLAQK